MPCWIVFKKIMMTLSFILCLSLFLMVGLASAWQRKNTTSDYYLASRSVPPWLVGLSAVATNNSGYMFIGVIGYTYTAGISAAWLMLGWILGDFLASLFVHARLRSVALAKNQSSYIGALNAWAGFGGKTFQRVAALLSLIFLLAYAGAQLVAGGKALQVLLQWPQWWGAILGAVLVMLYCFAGGIRASIWTDAAQSLVMILAMGMMLFVAVDALGGVTMVIDKMSAVDGFLDPIGSDLWLPGVGGLLAFIVGWLVAGFSVIAQPHIMVRFMTLNSTKGMLQTRAWYYLWFIIFYLMATGVGLLARIYLPESLLFGSAGFDAELALPTMAVQLLPSFLVGLVLAGIFAATMSTADSLLLSCSAFITQDLVPEFFHNNLRNKLATIAVTLAALTWALLNRESVFALVIFSWSMLGACFVPLILVLVLRQPLSQGLALAFMLGGCATVLSLHLWGMSGAIYVGVPALGVSVIIYALARLFGFAGHKGFAIESKNI